MTRPPVSVVIPTYNGRQLLEKHLPDVIKVLTKKDEIIIADDASTDDTIVWLESIKETLQNAGISLRWVVNSKNMRFSATVNAGVEKAKHEYVFLLNNDVSPLTPDSISLLLSWFEDETMFAVGCAEITEKVPDARVSGRGTGNFRRGLAVHWYDPNQALSNTLWTTGGSMLFDRKKFLFLGGMDTLYYPAYEEDRDLSYRALKHGWKVYFDPRVRVLHQHESTNASVFGKKKMIDDSWKNQYLFVWKNITDPSFLLQHLFWLPYHLTFSARRSNGAAWRGFWRAVQQLPFALHRRQTVKKLWKLSDKEVFTNAETPFAPFSS